MFVKVMIKISRVRNIFLSLDSKMKENSSLIKTNVLVRSISLNTHGITFTLIYNPSSCLHPDRISWLFPFVKKDIFCERSWRAFSRRGIKYRRRFTLNHAYSFCMFALRDLLRLIKLFGFNLVLVIVTASRYRFPNESISAFPFSGVSIRS